MIDSEFYEAYALDMVKQDYALYLLKLLMKDLTIFINGKTIILMMLNTIVF